MNYITKLNDEEIKYICFIMPLQDTINYFKRYPKEFTKIKPGFRPNSLRNREQIGSFLYKYRKNIFISSYIEKYIKLWIDEINNEIKMKIEKGESKEDAWIETLPFTYFANNIKIYFKLVDEELTEQYISILNTSIKKIKNLAISNQNLEEEINKMKTEIKELKDNVQIIEDELSKCSKKLNERNLQIEKLKRSCATLEEVNYNYKHEIDILNQKIFNKNNYLKSLTEELNNIKKNNQKLDKEIIEKQRIRRLTEKTEKSNRIRSPKNINEFKEIIGYNFINIGINPNEDYFLLLIEYLCDILFQGKPIIINRATGKMLTKCIANTLIGSIDVPILSFNSEIKDREIDHFLATRNRICCLDNFIGNYNETSLITICDKHKDKIIFFTFAYERTLYYIPYECFKYWNYININRIKNFYCDHDLVESRAPIEETEVSFSTKANDSDTQWTCILKEILNDFGISRVLSIYKSLMISDETSLCCYLAFDVIPFCVDVLGISPFNISFRLNRYAGNNGRCPHKELLRRWFM